MPRRIHVHLLPALITPEQLAGKSVVVIDVLRATTTVVHALACGAKAVIPCLEVEETLRLAGQSEEECLMGGEREGLKIEGFDLGNSPGDYEAEKVAGKTIYFTTTNGAKAMLHSHLAGKVWIGAFTNFSALCDLLAGESEVDLLCAGTQGEITREDVLLAGAVADELTRAAGDKETALNDQAEIALDAWRSAVGEIADDVTPLLEELRRSRGGRNMIQIGQERDIEIAAGIDRFEVVPRLDLQTWRIELC